MATFPQLKTNAIAQYPVARREQFQNQTVRFVDGSDQRYRDSAGPRMEWEIELSELDEGELAAIEEFFLASQGAFGSFLLHRPMGRARVRQLQPGRRRGGFDDRGGDAGEHEAHRGAEHLKRHGSISTTRKRGAEPISGAKNPAAADGGESSRRRQHDQTGGPGGTGYGMGAGLHGPER